MGYAPSATVYWGFNLGDMIDEDWESLKPAWMEPEGDDEDGIGWETAYAMALGWKPVPFPDGAPERDRTRGVGYENAERRYQEANERFNARPDVKAYDAAQDAKRAIVEWSPVKMDTYGSMDDPCHYICIKASVQSPPDWGDMELQPLVVVGNWEAQLLEFAKLLELIIPEGKQPAWHVNCSYG